MDTPTSDHRHDRPSDEQEGEIVSFPFDRMTVQRFREHFPKARWNEELKAWTVPGKTARRRIERWRAQESLRLDTYANEKGRDAYAFEPILSAYLDVGDLGLRIRIPYSRTIVEELRQIPFARWDGDLRVWHVPFASYDDLRRRWETIEAAAKRNEPDQRRARAEARKGTQEEMLARRRTAERRRRRIALPADDLPPLEMPVATGLYGIVSITDVTGELAEDRPADAPADDNEHARDFIWCLWRVAELDELVQTWPAKAVASAADRERGWWFATLEELREARQAARARERRRRRASISSGDDVQQ